MKKEWQPKIERIQIAAPNVKELQLKIRGSRPLVVCAFSEKAREEIRLKQEKGDTAETATTKKVKRSAKDFKQQYEDAKHISEEGWCGIPSIAFLNAMVRACLGAGMVMTTTKIALSVVPDGYDRTDGVTGLVKITKGEPRYFETAVRINHGTTTDLRARPMWSPGWEAVVKVSYDADQLTAQDIAHLLMRAGEFVGICEGRPSSKQSCGQDWGKFVVGVE